MIYRKHKSAAGIVAKRIKELERLLELIAEGRVSDPGFIKNIEQSLRVNQELYAYLVDFAGDNLVH